MSFWKNIFSPVEDATYVDEEEGFFSPQKNTRVLSFKGRAERLRRVIDPKGKPKDNLADEVDYLASCLKMKFPTGATIPTMLDLMDEKVLGLSKKSSVGGLGEDSIGDLVDRMVAELKLTVSPDDDIFKKLECVEKHLSIDSTKAAEKPLIDRVKVPYRMIFGS